MTSRAAFFDLDGTLIAKPSTELRFLRYLWQRRVLGPRQIIAGLLFYPVWMLRLGRDVGRKNKAFLTGLIRDEVKALAREWLDDNLSNLIDAEIRSQVEHCRRQGQTLILLTGAPDFLAEPIAEYLGMDHCISTLFDLRETRFRARPPLRHPLAAEKLTIAGDWCRDHGVNLADCTAYGDSHQDYALLNAVGIPVAVNPDRRMVRMANSKKWQVMNTP